MPRVVGDMIERLAILHRDHYPAVIPGNRVHVHLVFDTLHVIRPQIALTHAPYPQKYHECEYRNRTDIQN